MRGFSHYRAIRARALTLLICLLSLLTLITSPVQRAHQLGTHYRSSEIRREFVRHAYVDHAGPGQSSNVIRDVAQAAFPVWLRPITIADRNDRDKTARSNRVGGCDCFLLDAPETWLVLFRKPRSPRLKIL